MKTSKFHRVVNHADTVERTHGNSGSRTLYHVNVTDGTRTDRVRIFGPLPTQPDLVMTETDHREKVVILWDPTRITVIDA